MRLTTYINLEYLYNNKILALLNRKSDVTHTHDRINGYKVVVSDQVPSGQSNDVITIYMPTTSASRMLLNSLNASQKLSSAQFAALGTVPGKDNNISEDELSYNVVDTQSELTVEPIDTKETEVVIEEPVTLKAASVEPVNTVKVADKLAAEDPFTDEFIESILTEGSAVTIDDIQIVIHWNLGDTLSTGQEFGDYTLTVVALYPDEDNKLVPAEGVEYQLERTDGSILHARSEASSFQQILSPNTWVQLRIFFEGEEKSSKYQVPDIAFPIVSLRNETTILTSKTANTLNSYSTLSWDVESDETAGLEFVFTKPAKYTSQIYKDFVVNNILNADSALPATYQSVGSMINSLEVSDLGLWNTIYSTSTGDSVFAVPGDYISKEPGSTMYYLVTLTTIDDVPLNMVVELHVI